MFGLFKRKKEEPYQPIFGRQESSEEEPVEGHEEIEADPYADVEPGEAILPVEGDGEMTRLEDGRELPASFVREIRSLPAEELKLILEEQRALYSEAEYAYVREVFAERLGD